MQAEVKPASSFVYPTVAITGDTVIIGPDGRGDIVIRGDDLRLVHELSLYLHKKLLYRGQTFGDALRTAIILAKQFGGTVLEIETLRARVKKSWVRLMKAHLTGDPAQEYGRRMDEFSTIAGLSLRIIAYRRRQLFCERATVATHDPQYIFVNPRDRSVWKTRWENLKMIHFPTRRCKRPRPCFIADSRIAHLSW